MRTHLKDTLHLVSEWKKAVRLLKFSRGITCSGERSNTLSPMVNETLGIDGRELHATADSPFGLGSRSQS